MTDTELAKWVWMDRLGILHKAVGEYAHPNIFLMWTACGKHDIPANKSWMKRDQDTVNCSLCANAKTALHEAVEGGK